MKALHSRAAVYILNDNNFTEETETVNQNHIPKFCIAVAYCLSMITTPGLNNTPTRIYYLWRIEIIKMDLITYVLCVANNPIYM